MQEVAVDPDLVGMLTREELVRKVTQVYTLERLAVQDVATALPLLLALAQVNLSQDPPPSGWVMILAKASRLVPLSCSAVMQLCSSWPTGHRADGFEETALLQQSS